jgi:hypothetical protein
MYCANCGKFLEDDACFCPDCGTAVNETAAPIPQKKKSNKLWVVLVCIVILAVAAVGFLKPDSPTSSFDSPANPPASAEYTQMLASYGYEDYTIYQDNQRTIAFLEEMGDGELRKSEYLCENDRITEQVWYYFIPHDRTLEEQRSVIEQIDDKTDNIEHAVFEDYYLQIIAIEIKNPDMYGTPEEFAKLFLESGAIQR